MAQGSSSVRSVVNALVGLVLLAVLAGLCVQIYRVSTGQTPVYGRAESVDSEVKHQVTAPPAKRADTPQVQAIVGTQPVSPSALGGSDDQVTFRSPSGQLACVIAKDLAAVNPDGWVPLPANAKGTTAHGPGAVCVGIANLGVHPEDVHACGAGESLRSSVVGVWNESNGIGVCSPATTKMYADAQNHAEGGDRYDLPELKYGMHVAVGDYGCTISGAHATCAQLSTGRGFTIEDNVGYQFFAAR